MTEKHVKYKINALAHHLIPVYYDQILKYGSCAVHDLYTVHLSFIYGTNELTLCELWIKIDSLCRDSNRKHTSIMFNSLVIKIVIRHVIASRLSL